jgi:hypothetical protein
MHYNTCHWRSVKEEESVGQVAPALILVAISFLV